MNLTRNLPVFIIFLLFLLSLLLTFAVAAIFEVQNQCPYTVWAAKIPDGGMRLDQNQSWAFFVTPGTANTRIWGRTGCTLNDSTGDLICQTGDCGGGLRCHAYGSPPVTLAEFALMGSNQMDFFDISLVDGFNIPMDFSPTTGSCKHIRCAANITAECPNELKAPEGCNNPCTVYKTNEYCCNNGQGSCGPTNLSKFFKSRCPDAYSYPMDDQSSTFTCPTGTNYKVVFCPK